MAAGDFVQTAVDDGNPDAVCVFGSNNTGGNTLVVYAEAITSTSISISDSAGNTYTEHMSQSIGNERYRIWTAPVGSTGANTVTVSETGGETVAAIALEYEGALTFDAVTAGTSYSSTNAPTSGNITTSGAALIVGLVTFAGGGFNLSGASGYTARTPRITDSVFWVDQAGDKKETSSGTYQATFSLDGTSSYVVVHAIALLTAGAAAGQPTMPRWDGPGRYIAVVPSGSMGIRRF